MSSSGRKLEQLLGDISSKSEENRLKAARQVGRVFQQNARELSHDSWQKFSSDLMTHLSELINSTATPEQHGGLLLIQELMPLDCEDNASKLTNFANFLRLPFGNSSDAYVLQAASHALGLLAKSGGNEFVEPELKRALQRLKVSNRLESAVLVVRELATNAPTLLYVHVAEVIDHLWTAMRHASVAVREGAAQVLHATLELVASRAGGKPREISDSSSVGVGAWYKRVFEEAKAGFELGTPESVHGALLTTCELLGPAGPQLDDEQLQEIFNLAWDKGKDHKEKVVRNTLNNLLPTMARHCAESKREVVRNLFIDVYLKKTMEHLLSVVRASDKEMRGPAFLAIGETALATTYATRQQQQMLGIGPGGAHHSSMDREARTRTPSTGFLHQALHYSPMMGNRSSAVSHAGSVGAHGKGRKNTASLADIQLAANIFANTQTEMGGASGSIGASSLGGGSLLTRERQVTGPLGFFAGRRSSMQHNAPGLGGGSSSISPGGASYGGGRGPLSPVMGPEIARWGSQGEADMLAAMGGSHGGANYGDVSPGCVSAGARQASPSTGGGAHPTDFARGPQSFVGATGGNLSKVSKLCGAGAVSAVDGKVNRSPGGRRMTAQHSVAGGAGLLGQATSPVVAGGFLKDIVKEVRENLGGGKKKDKKKDYVEQAVVCVAKLAVALGTELEEYCDEQLYSQLFACPLTKTLTEALARMAHHLPQQLPELQKKLLDLLTSTLTSSKQQTFDDWLKLSAQERTASATAAIADAALHTEGGGGNSNQQLALALSTLGDFNGGEWGVESQILEFINQCASSFLDADAVEVRQAAAVACCSLLVAHAADDDDCRGDATPLPELSGATVGSDSHGNGTPRCGHADDSPPPRPRNASWLTAPTMSQAQHRRISAAVLQKVLVCGVVDPEGIIRQLIFSYLLLGHFDRQLAQPEALRCLCMALNDENAAIKQVAVQILGRLCHMNAAYALPVLRTNLIQLMTDIENSRSSSQREESAKLLGALLENAAHLIQPYTASIFAATLPRVHDESASVSASVLRALGNLASVGGAAVHPFSPQLLPPIVEALRDQASLARRHAALGALSQLVRATGKVGEPYQRFPDLLPMLLGMLTSEREPSLRLELLRALGVLGALDPGNKMQMDLQLQRASAFKQMQAKSGSAAGPKPKTGVGQVSAVSKAEAAKPASHPEFFHSVAAAALMGVLRDPSLQKQHREATQALVFIFQALGSKGTEAHLEQVLPLLVDAVDLADLRLREFLIGQLCELVRLVKKGVRPHVARLIELAKRYWYVESGKSSDKVQGSCVGLVETIATSLIDEIAYYLPTLLPMMLNVLQEDRAPKRENTRRVLRALESMVESLEPFLYSVVPAVLELTHDDDTPLDVRKEALLRLGGMCTRHDVGSLASLLVHKLCRVLGMPFKDLRADAMATLYGLAYQLGADYLVLEPTVRQVMRRQAIHDEKYERLLLMIMQGMDLQSDPSLAPPNAAGATMERRRRHSSQVGDGDKAPDAASLMAAAGDDDGDLSKSTLTKRFNMDATKLSKAWETRQRSTLEDWNEWFRAFSLELLRESPSPALRCCSALAERNPELAYDLFNASFISCWEELISRDSYLRQQLTQNVLVAMESDQMPQQLLQRLLNLNEFLERNEKPLGIAWKTLGKLARQSRAYAKALHYLEAEFEQGCSSQTIEALMSINRQLGQVDAARGILEHAKVNHKDQFKESWYETLNDWTQALKAYERRQDEQDPETGAMATSAATGYGGHPGNVAVSLGLDFAVGKMRCHHALAEWPALAELASQAWEGPISSELYDEAEPDVKWEVAKLGAASAWNLAALAADDESAQVHWEAMRKYTMHMRQNSLPHALHLAVLALHDGRLQPCQLLVEQARRLLDGELTALVGESYSRAYRFMVTAQQLAELEEVLLLRRAPLQTSLPHLLDMWRQRLGKCEQHVEVWQELLSVHSLAARPPENLETQLDFAELCRRSHRAALAASTLRACGDSQVAVSRAHCAPSLWSSSPKHSSWDARVRAASIPEESFSSEMLGASTTTLTDGDGDTVPALVPALSKRTSAVARLSKQSSSGLELGSSSPLSPLGLSVLTQNGSGSGKEGGNGGVAGSVVAMAPPLMYAHALHLWSEGDRLGAMGHLRSFLEVHGSVPSRPGATSPSGRSGRDSISGPDMVETRSAKELALAASAWVKLGEWERKAWATGSASKDLSAMRGLGGTLNDEEAVAKIANCFGSATALDPASYKAYHALAMVHFEAVQGDEEKREATARLEEESGTSPGGREGEPAAQTTPRPPFLQPTLSSSPLNTARRGSNLAINPRRGSSKGERDELVERHVVAAIGAFFRSIALGVQMGGNALQDILRLLTLWFRYGGSPNVDAAIRRGLGGDDASASAPIQTWLAVTPQIIARLHNPHHRIRQAVLRLLVRMAHAHPQGLIYPLAVAAKSKDGAVKVLNEIRESEDTLVGQAELVSDELIRTSVLWAEMWQGELEEASRVYFGDASLAPAKAATLMWDIVRPLHEMMAKGPETMSEISFVQQFGRPLQEAHEWMLRYLRTGERTDVSAAWDLYYHVFRRINKQVGKLNKMDLSAVSPKLLAARDLELAVPGTYRPGEPAEGIVRIKSFARTMSVIVSKQRPRKILLHGDDGVEYAFLLKGHEDLRQDERVMQLFGLVNSLLASEQATGAVHLSVHTYSVVPLSPNSGIISWVENCDTLNALVQDYRAPRGIKLKIEHMLMAKYSPDSGYDSLPLIHKVEVYKRTLEETAGKDLAQVLWLKSRSAEHWLDRRTNFTRSLATMSMVGYILGLGDRHMSNLMLEQFSGKILHIDFGDCFEVAINRAKFPEKVPFRLTRMLVNAMGVSGVEGNFRCTCESVMGVLRHHKDSVMAMLEAFLHDPLISWNLEGRKEGAAAAGAASGKDGAKGGADDGRGASASDAGDRAVSASYLETPQHMAASIGMQELSSSGGGYTSQSVSSNRPRNRSEQSEIAAETEQADERSRGLQAFSIIKRIKAKMHGTDFAPPEKEKDAAGATPPPPTPLDTPTQVARLITEATAHENLCQMYFGWNPNW